MADCISIYIFHLMANFVSLVKMGARNMGHKEGKLIAEESRLI